MKKPTIVHVVEAFGGGVFESISQITHLLSDRYHFIIIHGVRAETPKDFQKRFPKGTRFIPMPASRGIGMGDVRAVRFLRKELREIKPHFVHAHSSKAGALARLAAMGLGMRVGYSPRGYAFLMSSSSKLARLVYLSLEVILGQLPATTIACGHDEASLARWVTSRVVTIPNGINCDEVTFRKRTLTKGPLRVVASGRPSPQKGYERFLEFSRNCSDLPVTFTWVGGPVPDNIPLPENVTITGWVPHDIVQEEFKKAHTFLSLSLWEGLPRAVLEAMASGLPVILSDIAGHRELASQKGGYICRSSEELKEIIKKWHMHPTELTRQSIAARHHIEQNYNTKHQESMWVNLYDNA